MFQYTLHSEHSAAKNPSKTGQIYQTQQTERRVSGDAHEIKQMVDSLVHTFFDTSLNPTQPGSRKIAAMWNEDDEKTINCGKCNLYLASDILRQSNLYPARAPNTAPETAPETVALPPSMTT